MSKSWLAIALFIASVATAGFSHSRLPIERPEVRGAGFVPDPNHTKALALGFDALLADYQWLRAVQLVGGSDAVDREHAADLGRLVDVITTLNPHVDHPYRFAAIWLTHDEAQVREGIRLLRRAIAHHPEEWRNHFYLGFAQFFYLGEYVQAGESLERAMALPGAPAYLPRLVARLRAQSGDIDVAEVFLREMLADTTDPEDRKRLQRALDEIELEYKARLLDRARLAYRKATGRDIEKVTDLVRPPHRMLERLPSPEPDGLPAELARGSRWKIDRKTGRIVTTYLRKRYEVHYSAVDRARLEEWGGAKAPETGVAQ